MGRMLLGSCYGMDTGCQGVLDGCFLQRLIYSSYMVICKSSALEKNRFIMENVTKQHYPTSFNVTVGMAIFYVFSIQQSSMLLYIANWHLSLIYYYKDPGLEHTKYIYIYI